MQSIPTNLKTQSCLRTTDVSLAPRHRELDSKKGEPERHPLRSTAIGAPEGNTACDDDSKPPSRRKLAYCGKSKTSPPALVPMALNTTGETLSEINRTDPSAKAMFKPPGCVLPNALIRSS